MHPKFPKDPVSAHKVHKGNEGVGSIDQKAALDQAQALIDAGRAGAATITKIETTEIAVDGGKKAFRAMVEVVPN